MWKWQLVIEGDATDESVEELRLECARFTHELSRRFPSAPIRSSFDDELGDDGRWTMASERDPALRGEDGQTPADTTAEPLAPGL